MWHPASDRNHSASPAAADEDGEAQDKNRHMGTSSVLKFPQPQTRTATVRNPRKTAELLAFPSARQVTLTDLAEYKILSREAAGALEKLARKREEIVRLLRAGAHVEKCDLLTARLVTISRSGKTVERLEVR
jgi:hypothetical protein